MAVSDPGRYERAVITQINWVAYLGATNKISDLGIDGAVMTLGNFDGRKVPARDHPSLAAHESIKHRPSCKICIGSWQAAAMEASLSPGLLVCPSEPRQEISRRGQNERAKSISAGKVYPRLERRKPRRGFRSESTEICPVLPGLPNRGSSAEPRSCLEVDAGFQHHQVAKSGFQMRRRCPLGDRCSTCPRSPWKSPHDRRRICNPQK